MSHCHAGLSLMPDDAFRRAAEPLFAEDEVDAVEWTFDMCWNAPLPTWMEERICEFNARGQLLGHSVSYSPLSARWGPRETDWLRRMRHEDARRNYVHVSEHFGFCRGGDFHHSAPLPVPLTQTTLRMGQDRLRRLADAIECPIGLENLAFAFSRQDVEQQGEFLDKLLDAVDGFLLLDLHNMYCQSLNFGIDAERLLRSYPLHRVRELHVSGGSFSESREVIGAAPVRRDTHNGPVPPDVFDLLRMGLAACPRVAWVIFEQLGHSLNKDTVGQWQSDFRRLKSIVQECSPTERDLVAELDEVLHSLCKGDSPEQLVLFQAELLRCLAEDKSLADRQSAIATHPAMQPFRSYVQSFDPRMLEVAVELVKQWGQRLPK